MIYLFLGEDSAAKDQKLTEIKKKVLPSPDAFPFDYEVLHAHHLDAEVLKKVLVTLPAIAKERLVIIRQCHKLTPHTKDLIRGFVRKSYSPTTLILDSEELDEASAFVKEVARFVQIYRFQSKEELNVFHLTRAISMRKKVEALNILAGLLAQGEYPLQLMGGLVWSWKKSRGGMPAAQFKKGLADLQQADLNIKRSRLKAEYALELLVIKLCSREAG